MHVLAPHAAGAQRRETLDGVHARRVVRERKDGDAIGLGPIHGREWKILAKKPPGILVAGTPACGNAKIRSVPSATAGFVDHLPHRSRAASQARRVFTLQTLPACDEP